jgi:uncharacterized protein involved in outer membrane biogenesis
MKKLAVRLLIALVVVLILAVLIVGLFLDGIIKHGVETIGPALTKVDIKLDSVSLSLLSGSGKINGLVVGNPEGFKTPSAVKVGTVSLALKPGSLLSDKVVIKSIQVQGPEITYETDFKSSNLSKIRANVEAATGGSAPKEPGQPQPPAQPAPAKPSKKLEVDEFVISGAKLHVSATALGGKTFDLTLPDIHLPALGTSADGITAGELVKKILEALEKEAANAAASGALGDLGKQASDYLNKQLGNTNGSAAGTITKGLGDLFKKK